MKKAIIEFPGFTDPKPTLSKWNYLWLIAVVAGVVGLGFVAYTSMRKQGFEPVPAGVFAFLMEVGTFGAAFNLVRGNKVTLIEIVVGLLTSGVYNYVHIRAVNVQAITKVADTDWFLIGVFGLGPLAVTFSAALWVGREIHKYNLAVAAWRKAGKEFVDAQAKKADEDHQEAQRREEEARQRKEEADRLEREKQAQMQMQFEFQRERLRMEEETKREVARIEQEAKVEATRVRVEARAQLLPAGGRTSSRTSTPRGTYQDYVNLLASNGTHNYTNKELADRFGVTTRTITDWRARHKEGQAQPVAEIEVLN